MHSPPLACPSTERCDTPRHATPRHATSHAPHVAAAVIHGHPLRIEPWPTVGTARTAWTHHGQALGRAWLYRRRARCTLQHPHNLSPTPHPGWPHLGFIWFNMSCLDPRRAAAVHGSVNRCCVARARTRDNLHRGSSPLSFSTSRGVKVNTTLSVTRCRFLPTAGDGYC